MKLIFAVLCMSIATYDGSAQEIINLSKPTMEMVSSSNMAEGFMEKLRQKIPNEIQLPDQVSNGGPEFICSSTSFKLVDSFVRGLKEFTYNFDYSGRAVPSRYSFKVALEAGSNYKLSCSPWLKFLGPLNISVVNLQLDGNIATTQTPPTIRFTTLSTYVDVVSVNINGIFNDATSAIISMLVTDRATDLINENQEAISNRLMKYINDLLETIVPRIAAEQIQNASLEKYNDKNAAISPSIFNSAMEEVMMLVESIFDH